MAASVRAEPVPIRDDPRTADAFDPKRVELVVGRWSSQDEAFASLGRTVEEHVRMLSGRQWDVWSDLWGRFVDPRQYMTAEELQWRQRPVMDFLGYWFLVTLSKVTENLPVIGFLPKNLDEQSAKLAELCDPLFKSLFDDAEMPARYAEVAAWAITGGQGYLLTRPDFTKGAERELRGPAVLTLEREGMDPIERLLEDVPFGESGEPLASLEDDGFGEAMEVGMDAPAYKDRVGGLAVEVASVLEVRSQWGANIPWNKKAWIIHRWFLDPDEVEARWGVRVDPDTFPDMDESSPGYLERLLFGSGYFGAARQDGSGQGAAASTPASSGLVCGYTQWERPCGDYPKGRLTVVGGGQVLHDSIRPADFECAGPIRKVAFVQIPGRPVGSTMLEKMVPLQKRYNRIEAQIAEHANRCTSPILAVHADAGIDTDSLRSKPGEIVEHDAPPGVEPIKYVSPGQLSSDIWRHKEQVREQLFAIGAMTVNDGQAPTATASGELVSQIRYNTDRPFTPLTRELELAWAGVAEDMLAILPTIWTEEQVIHAVGEDNLVRTITVLPDLFEGSVTARPVLESAAPESREARQARVDRLYAMGAWGDPKSPDPAERERAMKRYLDVSRYPDLNRAARPGGEHRLMAERNLSLLVRGTLAEQIPVLVVYNLAVHLDVLTTYMASPDYLERPFEIQNEMERYRLILESAQQVQQLQTMERAGDAAALEGLIANRVSAIAPPPNTPQGTPPASPPGARPARSSGQAA